MPALSLKISEPRGKYGPGAAHSPKPLGWLGSLATLVVLGGLIYIAHYRFAPAYTAATGQPYLVGYLIAYTSTVTDRSEDPGPGQLFLNAIASPG
jgi:hypothetical protein